MFKAVFFNNALLLAQYAVTGLIPLLLIPHIVRNIGLQAYGEIAIGLAWANYGAIVVQYAFQLTGPRAIAQLKPGELAKNVFLEIAGAKLLLLGAGSGLVIAAAPLLLHDNTQWIRVLVFFLIPVGAAFQSGWFLQATNRYLDASGISIMSAGVSLAVGFGLVSANATHGTITAALALTIGPLLAGLGTFMAAWRLLRHEVGKLNWSTSINALREGWTLFSSQFTSALYTASGPIVVGALVNLGAAGAYSAVERFVNAIIGLLVLTHTAAYPKLASLYFKQRRDYWRLIGFVIGVYLACASIIIGILMFTGNALVRFLFGGVAEGGGALIGWGMAWMLFGIFGVAVTGFLTVSGNQHRVLPLTFWVMVVSLALGIPGVILFGAWAWMAALVVSQAIVLGVGWRAWKEATVQVKRAT